MNQLLQLPGLALLAVPVDIAKRFTDLLERHGVLAQHAFDAFLIATMLGNGVRHIYTFNASHFTPFDEIKALVPGTTPKR